MIRLGLDVHGVIDHIPDHLRKLAFMTIQCNGEVHVITGGDKKRTEDQVNKLSFPYTHFFSIQDYLNDKYYHENIGLNLMDGKLLYPDWLWDKAKALYCKENQIDLHIDDSPEYREHFETPFLYFQRKRFTE